MITHVCTVKELIKELQRLLKVINKKDSQIGQYINNNAEIFTQPITIEIAYINKNTGVVVGTEGNNYDMNPGLSENDEPVLVIL